MNYQVRVVGIDGAWIFHAERWGPDDWRWTGSNYSGMLISHRGGMITALADLIGKGEVYAVESPLVPYNRVGVDRLGGSWFDGPEKRYVPAHELIQLLVPEDWSCES